MKFSQQVDRYELTMSKVEVSYWYSTKKSGFQNYDVVGTKFKEESAMIFCCNLKLITCN